jgi:hypothetical protein
MNKTMKILLVAALAVMTSAAAMAQVPMHVCAYVNDNNYYFPNNAEGYMIGPGEATHVGPYVTNGLGSGDDVYQGGLAAAREGDLYVEDPGSVPVNITHFSINKTDCTLSLDTSLYPDGNADASFGDRLAITPDGKTMFVGSDDYNNIYSLAIAGNGSLGSPVAEASTPGTKAGFEVSPDGKALVVGYPDNQEICAYPISKRHLGTPNCQPTVDYLDLISIDPASACVYGAETSSSSDTSEVEAFTLTGGVLGTPTDYKPFGPGGGADGILVSSDNKTIYLTEDTAQMAMGSVAPGCRLTYKTTISDGTFYYDAPGQIAQAKTDPEYVVNGDGNLFCPTMGIFHVGVNGKLTPIGSGQLPLLQGGDVDGVDPSSIVVVGPSN